MSYKSEMKEADSWAKGWIVWVAVFLFAVSGIAWFFNRADKTAENAIIRYEEFEDLYATCNKLETDLCNKREMPDDDKSFEQFSKAQQINTVKTNLNRWVQEYNAKSRKWNHSMWKSKTLPYELSVDDFKCYNESNQKNK